MDEYCSFNICTCFRHVDMLPSLTDKYGIKAGIECIFVVSVMIEFYQRILLGYVYMFIDIYTLVGHLNILLIHVMRI